MPYSAFSNSQRRCSAKAKFSSTEKSGEAEGNTGKAGEQEGGRGWGGGGRFPAFLTHAVSDSFAPFVVITAALGLMRRRTAGKSASDLPSCIMKEVNTHTRTHTQWDGVQLPNHLND